MKKVLLSLFVLIFILTANSQTGCPGCVVDVTCTGTEPTLCPATLPDGTVGVPYDQDLTFYVPSAMTVSGVNVTVLSIVINSVAGIPQGLQWQSNSPNNSFNITPPGSHGCVKICGTPLLPGNYIATVIVTATASTPLGNQVQQQQFSLPMTINAPAFGCFLFSASPSGDGCGAVCDTFTALYEASSPYSSSYNWSFGNGNGSSIKNPPVQCYNSPGEYPVQLTVTNWKYVIDSVTAQTSGNWWCGDFEEPEFLGACTGSPDLILTMASGNSSLVSSEYTNNTSANWWNLDFTLDNFALSLSFIDNDNVSQDDNGGASSIVVNGPGVYNYSTTSPFGGGISGSVWVHLEVDTQYTCSDTVVVTALPPTTSMSAFPDTVVCSKDSMVLSVYTGQYSYTWYKDSTTIIPFQTGSSYTVMPSPYLTQDTVLKIRVDIRDTTTGCIRTVYGEFRMKPDVPPNFSQQGLWIQPSNPNVIKTQTQPNYQYQWFYNGIPIAGADTTFYSPTVNGPYYVIYTAPSGCSDTSNTINFIYQDIAEINDMSALLDIYPNPANDNVKVLMNMSVSESIRLQIIDLTGKVVKQTFINEKLTELNLSDITNGNYLIQLAGDKFIARKKLVILH